MQDIQIQNTLSGKKEVFKPIEPGKVGIYACGVTTYDHYHIGHALQAVYFDMICRYFRYRGFQVTYVRNYTDVDDKIINRAKENGISPALLSEDIIRSSEEDMQALGCIAPNHAPRVSRCIPEIITMIEELIHKGAAYTTSCGDVYYRVRTKADYGKLSNRRVDELRCGTRDLVEGGKEDELDFALWKADQTRDASWDSPWGVGRPGWHIECSVMSRIHLGKHFDIHGGGRDLVFPHHENEIAQSESANDCAYANYWVHSGLLTIEKQKMSKSLGNHITLKDFLLKWPGESLRLAYLQHQYGSNIDFAKDTFKKAHQRLYYYYATIAALDDLAQKASTDSPFLLEFSPEAVKDTFHRAMSDDFNSCVALVEINKQFKKANELLKLKNTTGKYATAKAMSGLFRELMGVFGLLQRNPMQFTKTLKLMFLPELGITEREIDGLIGERRQARQNKDFSRSDAIRDKLAAKGIELMDTPERTDWKIKYDD